MVFEPLSDGVRKLVFREPREQLELCIVEELPQDFDSRAASSPEGIRSLNPESLAQLVFLYPAYIRMKHLVYGHANRG